MSVSNPNKVNPTQIRIWVIIGDSDTGKSSMIGHLVGMFAASKNNSGITSNNTKEFHDVLLRTNGFLRMWTLRGACQERGEKPAEIIKKIKEKAIRLQKNSQICAGFFNVLLPLRLDEEGHCPDALTYLTAFALEGWSIENIVLMPPEVKYISDVRLNEILGNPNKTRQEKTNARDELASKIKNVNVQYLGILDEWQKNGDLYRSFGAPTLDVQHLKNTIVGDKVELTPPISHRVGQIRNLFGWA